ncbi:hypothetical protein LEP1GSC109_3661 [Leptospira interrogans str. UI 13372]|nr:hypothetical protein LEP1GSC109_3661 [Leptospira interrogans str. UI 13372]
MGLILLENSFSVEFLLKWDLSFDGSYRTTILCKNLIRQ